MSKKEWIRKGKRILNKNEVCVVKGSEFIYLGSSSDYCDYFKVVDKNEQMTNRAIATELFKWFYRDIKNIDYTWKENEDIITLREYVPFFQDEDNVYDKIGGKYED